MTRLIVLAKPPRRGECKSRLAADIGAGPATRLARAMLRDGWATATAACAGRERWSALLATSAPGDAYPVLLPTPATSCQGEGDLGRRMARQLAAGLREHERVLLLGTDSPGLPIAHIDAAVAALANADIVLGAHADGGFWCLGARRGAPALADERWLDGLRWDADATREQVLERAAELRLGVGLAPAWFDIDRGDDLARLRQVLAERPESAPETAAELVRQDRARGERISIVVASLDEGRRLDACLAALREQPGPLELIVADGGSQDGSAERAARAPDVTVVVTGPGRGRQLAAGAALATSELLLFSHVDTRLPAGGTELVRCALADGSAEAGAFVTTTRADPDVPNPVGPLLRLADIRSRVTRHPYGDQAMFVTRAAYDAVGGFRDQPIMEDYDLSVRLAARRRLARIRSPVTVSGRRLQRRPIRSMLLMRIIPPLYRMGVDPERLARLYRAR